MFFALHSYRTFSSISIHPFESIAPTFFYIGVSSGTYRLHSLALAAASTQRYEVLQVDIGFAKDSPLLIPKSTFYPSTLPPLPDQTNAQHGDLNQQKIYHRSQYTQRAYFDRARHPLNHVLHLECAGKVYSPVNLTDYCALSVHSKSPLKVEPTRMHQVREATGNGESGKASSFSAMLEGPADTGDLLGYHRRLRQLGLLDDCGLTHESVRHADRDSDDLERLLFSGQLVVLPKVEKDTLTSSLPSLTNETILPATSASSTASLLYTKSRQSARRAARPLIPMLALLGGQSHQNFPHTDIKPIDGFVSIPSISAYFLASHSIDSPQSATASTTSASSPTSNMRLDINTLNTEECRVWLLPTDRYPLLQQQAGKSHLIHGAIPLTPGSTNPHASHDIHSTNPSSGLSLSTTTSSSSTSVSSTSSGSPNVQKSSPSGWHALVEAAFAQTLVAPLRHQAMLQMERQEQSTLAKLRAQKRRGPLSSSTSSPQKDHPSPIFLEKDVEIKESTNVDDTLSSKEDSSRLAMLGLSETIKRRVAMGLTRLGKDLDLSSDLIELAEKGEKESESLLKGNKATGTQAKGNVAASNIPVHAVRQAKREVVGVLKSVLMETKQNALRKAGEVIRLGTTSSNRNAADGKKEKEGIISGKGTVEEEDGVYGVETLKSTNEWDKLTPSTSNHGNAHDQSESGVSPLFIEEETARARLKRLSEAAARAELLTEAHRAVMVEEAVRLAAKEEEKKKFRAKEITVAKVKIGRGKVANMDAKDQARLEQEIAQTAVHGKNMSDIQNTTHGVKVGRGNGISQTLVEMTTGTHAHETMSVADMELETDEITGTDARPRADPGYQGRLPGETNEELLERLKYHREREEREAQDASRIIAAAGAGAMNAPRHHTESGDYDFNNPQMQDMATMFFQTSTHIEAALGSGAHSTQILAAIVDPIIEQVPYILAEVAFELLMPHVVSKMRPTLADSMIEYFIPKQTHKIVPMPIYNAMEKQLNLPFNSVQLSYQDGAEGKAPVKYKYAIDFTTKASTASRLVNMVVNLPTRQAIDLMQQSLTLNMFKHLNRTVTRRVARALSVSLTQSIGSQLTRMTLNIFTRALTIKPAQSLTRILSSTLTNTVALTVTRALTRAPVADIFCELCRKGEELYSQQAEHVLQFCDACWSAEVAGQHSEYITAYYANYYNHYYTWHYGGYYAERFADGYFRMNQVGGRKPPPE